MLLKNLILTMTLLSAFIYAETFKKVNPEPTKTMLENIAKAKTCATPAPANEKVAEDFKYGCFCGKYHPMIEGNESKMYKKLNKEARIKVIEKYYEVKPYDDIDAVCQQHDICYFYQGKNAKVCNEAIHHELRVLVDKFKSKNKVKKNKQCQKLAYDMASVFKTIFTSADDENNPLELGNLMFNTSVTIANKTFEESLDTIIDIGPLYPPQGHQCLTANLE
jgi:hypothetical protein